MCLNENEHVYIKKTLLYSFAVTTDGIEEPVTDIVLESSLLLVSTVPSDSGRYTCNASNSQGHVTASAYLIVIGEFPCHLKSYFSKECLEKVTANTSAFKSEVDA